jgi:fucose 4-O-acetylase-like acetyltransferase
MPDHSRRADLDCAKGLGILLVVLGHLAAKSQPEGNVWYAYLQTALYQFHMPFFMYLSGYVSFLTGAAVTPLRAWPRLLQRRSARLLLPFGLFGLLFIVSKLVAAPFMHVDHPPASFAQGLTNLVWNTDESPALSVWYVGVLFVMSVMTPPVMWISRNNALAVLAVAAVLFVLPVPHVMYLDRVARFYIFFALGGVAADAGERWLRSIDLSTAIMCGIFALLLGVILLNFEAIPDALKLLVCGAASMPALHGMIREPYLERSSLLLQLGKYSFVIYLLNTVCIGLAKGLLLKLMPWDGLNFLVFVPLLMAAGTWGPILIKRYVFRPLPVIDRMTS